jgi:hypothetical protein
MKALLLNAVVSKTAARQRYLPRADILCLLDAIGRSQSG